MKSRRTIIAILLFLLLLFAVVIIWKNGRMSEVTVSAVIRMNEAGNRISRRAVPNTSAQMCSGNGDNYRPVTFDNGILRTDFTHGPIRIIGTFSADDISLAFPNTERIEDWPFSIAFYNTSSGRVFHMYLDISCDVEADTACADFYIFEDHNANATVLHWTGRPGETISVGPKEI